MANYNAVTGHKTSPNAHAGEDSSHEMNYACSCDGRVTYTVRAVDAWTAERKAKSMYWHDAGEDPKNIDVRVTR